MSETERWLAIFAFIAMIGYVFWRLYLEAQTATAVETAVAPQGTVPATAPVMAASLAAVADTGRGPSWLIYNAPGIYNMGPPIVNTVVPPSLTQGGRNLATGPSALTCNACGSPPAGANILRGPL